MNLAFKARVPVRAKISALGTYVPEKVVTNADIEKLVDTTDAWIVERTGIRERHVVDKGTATSDLASEAARRCLDARGVEASEVEVIIVATVTPDMIFPCTACLVQHKIGATGAWGFDLSAACAGFVFALQAGAKFIESGTHTKVLVIGADVMSSIIDFEDRSTCILFGDGAGAVLLEPCGEGELGLMDFVHEIDGSGAESLRMPAGGSLLPTSVETVQQRLHYVVQDGRAVYKFAVRKLGELVTKLFDRNDIAASDLGCFIPHQANKRIIEAVGERLKLKTEQIVINIEQFGNTTAATIPLAMATALERGQINRGSLVILASVGAGFTAGATLLQWEIDKK
jgi:3-oxoacyl-[acyl-carrier-protein] synthase-3